MLVELYLNIPVTPVLGRCAVLPFGIIIAPSVLNIANALAFAAPPKPIASALASIVNSPVSVSPSTIKSTFAPASFTRIALPAAPSIFSIPYCSTTRYTS